MAENRNNDQKPNNTNNNQKTQNRDDNQPNRSAPGRSGDDSDAQSGNRNRDTDRTR